VYRDDRESPAFFIYVVRVFLDSSHQMSFCLTDIRRITIFTIDFIYHIIGGQPFKSILPCFYECTQCVQYGKGDR